MLVISPEVCTGCRTCEVTCSLAHEAKFSPNVSRVTVYSWEEEGISVPMMCVQCEDAFCQNVCPTHAITRDSATGALLVSKAACIGCKLCVQACPFGGSAYDAASKQILKCDLCGGDPKCAKYCPSKALQYVDANKANTGRKRAYAARLKPANQGVNR
ncbi:MAG TPA: 4Fe-4S dicluster domain-containing protein [Symbiobacteriaceae bacterium]